MKKRIIRLLLAALMLAAILPVTAITALAADETNVTTIRLPAGIAGGSYVVVDAWGVPLRSEMMIGGVSYKAEVGTRITIYGKAAPGYRVVGFPYVIEKVAEDQQVDLAKLPKFVKQQSLIDLIRSVVQRVVERIQGLFGKTDADHIAVALGTAISHVIADLR